jgi:hypothetical protein
MCTSHGDLNAYAWYCALTAWFASITQLPTVLDDRGEARRRHPSFGPPNLLICRVTCAMEGRSSRFRLTVCGLKRQARA